MIVFVGLFKGASSFFLLFFFPLDVVSFVSMLQEVHYTYTNMNMMTAVIVVKS